VGLGQKRGGGGTIDLCVGSWLRRSRLLGSKMYPEGRSIGKGEQTKGNGRERSRGAIHNIRSWGGGTKHCVIQEKKMGKN